MSEWTGRVDTVGGRGVGMKQPDQFWAVPGVADGWTRDAGRVSEERSGRSMCVGLLKPWEQIRESRGSAERRGRQGLIARRRKGVALGSSWAFPGGPGCTPPVVLSGAVFHPQVLGEARCVCRAQVCSRGGSPEP